MKMFVWILIVPLLLAAPASSVIAKSPPSAGTEVALVSKVILDVKRKELDKDWVAAKRGETLASGDRVRTGVNSLAVIKFKDNSLVRIREQSELTITGNVAGRAFSKTVNLTRGAVGFNIKKQETGEEFSFRSPTSVASIRGTEGLYIATALQDLLTVLEGTIRFQNRISTTEVDVNAGYTGIAKPDGTILTRPSTPADQAVARNAMIEREDEQRNLLELEFRDAQGNRKQMRIDFK
jgi:hypothetical protein